MPPRGISIGSLQRLLLCITVWSELCIHSRGACHFTFLGIFPAQSLLVQSNKGTCTVPREHSTSYDSCARAMLSLVRVGGLFMGDEERSGNIQKVRKKRGRSSQGHPGWTGTGRGLNWSLLSPSPAVSALWAPQFSCLQSQVPAPSASACRRGRSGAGQAPRGMLHEISAYAKRKGREFLLGNKVEQFP